MPTNESLAGAVRDAVAPFSASPAIGADVTVRLANGGEVTLKLSPADFAAHGARPLPAAEEDADDPSAMSEKELQIFNAVRDAGERMTTEQIARKVKRNPKSGSLVRTLKSMASEERELLTQGADGKFGVFEDSEA